MNFTGLPLEIERSSSISIRGIDFSASEEDIRCAASRRKHGMSLVGVKLMRHADSNKSRGFGFLEFDSVESAEKFLLDNAQDFYMLGRKTQLEFSKRVSRPAPRNPLKTQTPALDWICETCSGHNFSKRSSCYKCKMPKTHLAIHAPIPNSEAGAGRSQNVKAPIENSVLCVKGLDPSTEAEKVRSAFQTFGEVKDVRIILDKITNLPKGICFVEFLNIADAINAFTQVHKKPVNSFQIDSRPVLCTYARPPKQTHSSSSQSSMPIQYFQAPSSIPDNLPEGFAFNPIYGCYFNAATNYYFDPNSSIFYNSSTGKYYKLNSTVQQYYEVDASGLPLNPTDPIAVADKISQESLDRPLLNQETISSNLNSAKSEHSSEEVDVSKPNAAPDQSEIPKPVISSKDIPVDHSLLQTTQSKDVAHLEREHLKKLSLGNLNTTKFSLKSKRISKDMMRWNQRKAELDDELNQEEEILAKKSLPSSFVDKEKLVCYLCHRKFKLLKTVLLHESNSELHQKNLELSNVEKLKRVHEARSRVQLESGEQPGSPTPIQVASFKNKKRFVTTYYPDNLLSNLTEQFQSIFLSFPL